MSIANDSNLKYYSFAIENIRLILTFKKISISRDSIYYSKKDR